MLSQHCSAAAEKFHDQNICYAFVPFMQIIFDVVFVANVFRESHWICDWI